MLSALVSPWSFPTVASPRRPHGRLRIGAALLAFLGCCPAWAALPQGYFVWIKGDQGAPESRKVYRMTLPDMDGVKALTAGEDVECQISPGGKWVAYAKAKLAGSDYHQFNRFWLYIVSIHGAGDGREELKIDDNGYWPSWGADNTLYYSQVDPDDRQHTRIIKAILDDHGAVVSRSTLLTTRVEFADIDEVNECFVAPGETWFAARTRGSSAVTGTGAFSFDPPQFDLLARAGSVGCMPYIAPSATWGFIAGRAEGIRWGHAPGRSDRVADALLVAPRSAGGFCYHPGISTDERWLMVAHSTDDDHNAGPYDVYIYELDGQSVTHEQLLAGGGFNGWPHLWVGEPSEPPVGTPHIDAFRPDTYTVVAGGPVQLHWQTSFADAVTLDGAPVNVDGSAQVSPASSTTYELEASRSGMQATELATVPITVNDMDQPVTIDTFTADPATVVAGDAVTLSWQVANAYTLDLDGTAVAPSGTLRLNPLRTSAHVLTAQGHGGPVQSSVTVTVTALPDVNELLPEHGGCMCQGHGTGLLWGLGTLLCALAVARRGRRGRRVVWRARPGTP